MPPESGSGTYVVFTLAGEAYALAVDIVTSIIPWEDPTPVPRSLEAVLGVINLRGRVIPVVDLSTRLQGRDFEPGPSSRIVVAEGSLGPVGIAVDSAREVATFSADEVRPVPDGVVASESARAFSGVVDRGGSLIVLIDLDEAVTTEASEAQLAEGGGRSA